MAFSLGSFISSRGGIVYAHVYLFGLFGLFGAARSPWYVCFVIADLERETKNEFMRGRHG